MEKGKGHTQEDKERFLARGSHFTFCLFSRLEAGHRFFQDENPTSRYRIALFSFWSRLGCFGRYDFTVSDVGYLEARNIDCVRTVCSKETRGRAM